MAELRLKEFTSKASEPEEGINQNGCEPKLRTYPEPEASQIVAAQEYSHPLVCLLRPLIYRNRQFIKYQVSRRPLRSNMPGDLFPV